MAIRVAAGVIPAACIVIGIVIFSRYPLTENTFATMVAETKARRAERHAGGVEDTAPTNRNEDA